MMTMRAPSVSTALSDQVGEFPGRQLCGIDLLDPDEAGLGRFLQGQTQGAGAGVHSASPFIEGEYDRMLAPRCRGDGVGKRQGRFADAGRADKQRVGAAFKASAQERIKLGVAAGDHVASEVLVMLGRDQARIDFETAALDREVVKAAFEVDPAHLDDAQAASLGTVVDGQLL